MTETAPYLQVLSTDMAETVRYLQVLSGFYDGETALFAVVVRYL